MKIIKLIIYFIMIVLSLIIAERGIIYVWLSITKPGIYNPVANPYPLSEISPFVQYSIAAVFVLVALWITNKIMYFFSFIKTKLIKNPS
ncbi:hypothetical protein [Lysinibacillus sp. G4S2]|uniref:hypothetical protein n=1 Tax=Lysinibacillus sp. G4S2 TaxID=3055859 RepID=UPI0025A15436|nr:hypothetical protein [Lysinibacillus sp. G4S2]MDM5250054.1 hypothetical protein [Lysinibacillus sp. G4S2]